MFFGRFPNVVFPIKLTFSLPLSAAVALVQAQAQAATAAVVALKSDQAAAAASGYQNACPNQASCGTMNNGAVATCGAAGQCVYSCSGSDAAPFLSNGVRSCINVANDTSNCGFPGTMCPGSYNGVGSSTCTGGVCGISCPAGTARNGGGTA